MDTLDILFEDEYLICVDKKSGVLSQGNEKTKSLSDYVADYLSTKGNALIESDKAQDRNRSKKNGSSVPYVGTVHRLDKLTSGIVMYSKDERTTARLSELFKDKKIEKTYLAIVEGKCDTKNGSMEDFLYFDRKKNKSFVVKKERKGVKKAKLNFSLLAYGRIDEKDVSLVKINLETGRTHQIRVQFSSRHMPVLGDRRYGSKINTNGIMLHSSRLSFTHPVTKENICLTSIPSHGYFSDFKEQLSKTIFDK